VIGLPSLQAIDRAQGARIWMASEATDMRCGFDRLAERVKTVIGENPQSGHLFVFRSRRGDRLKILLWERDGFVLWYKRLEARVFKLPQHREDGDQGFNRSRIGLHGRLPRTVRSARSGLWSGERSSWLNLAEPRERLLVCQNSHCRDRP